MTNMEAYIKDLDEIDAAIVTILQGVPIGESKKTQTARKKIEEIASLARADLQCMKNDYIPQEFGSDKAPASEVEAPEQVVVGEVKAVSTTNEANDLLAKGWILLDICELKKENGNIDMAILLVRLP